jgi:Cu+-exporting ATPase
LPQQKFALVEELKKEGGVIFVGDGINDAPSLKAADVGVAMNNGADVAKDAGDVILMRSTLSSALGALVLAGATVRTIKQNLAWAFIYNIVCIPLAAGALYPIFGLALTPSVGAAAMSVSSVSVVLNSLRLRRFKFE